MSEMHEFIDEPKLPHQCYHYLDNNHRCEATAMHGEYFCHLHRVKPSPIIYLPAEGFALPDLKDRDAIQLAVSQVADRIAGNQIDNKRAGLLLFAIQIASSNLPPHARATPSSPVTASSPVILTLSEVKGKNPRILPVQPANPVIPATPSPVTAAFPVILTLSEVKGKNPRISPVQPPNPAIQIEAANTPTLTSPVTGEEQPATLPTLQGAAATHPNSSPAPITSSHRPGHRPSSPESRAVPPASAPPKRKDNIPRSAARKSWPATWRLTAPTTLQESCKRTRT